MHILLTGVAAKVAAWVLPVVLGPLVYLVARRLLNVNLAIDALPPALKRIAVGVIGVTVAGAFAALGIAPPTECVGDATTCLPALSQPVVVQGITAALVAAVCHALKKAHPRT